MSSSVMLLMGQIQLRRRSELLAESLPGIGELASTQEEVWAIISSEFLPLLIFLLQGYNHRK